MKPIPREIKASGPDLTIHWSDGHAAHYNARHLRLACRCAACVDEWTHDVIIKPEDVPHDLKPANIAVVGTYALHFTWSDGHSTGIYSYDYLRSQCECEACKTVRHG